MYLKNHWYTVKMSPRSNIEFCLVRGLGNFYLLSSLQAEDTSELLDFTSGEYNANWNVIAHVARPESPHRFDGYYQPALPLKGLAVHTREHELTIQEIVLFCHDDLLCKSTNQKK